MGVGKVPHALLILLLAAAPTAMVESQPEVCAASIHVAGPSPLDPAHDGSHCRLSDNRGRAPLSIPATTRTSPQPASPLFVQAAFIFDVRAKVSHARVLREPGSGLSLFIQTRAILV